MKESGITRTNRYLKIQEEFDYLTGICLVFGFGCPRTGSGMDFCMPGCPCLSVFHLYLNLHRFWFSSGLNSLMVRMEQGSRATPPTCGNGACARRGGGSTGRESDSLDTF